LKTAAQGGLRKRNSEVKEKGDPYNRKGQMKVPLGDNRVGESKIEERFCVARLKEK